MSARPVFGRQALRHQARKLALSPLVRSRFGERQGPSCSEQGRIRLGLCSRIRSARLQSMIEDPVMNLKYLGRVSLTNSLLEEGDILLREGEMTERKSAPPPIQATIDPTWSTRSTMNNTSTITCLTLSPVRLLCIYDVGAG